ncbi:hypothetical protein [Microbacterium dauci]|uniref:Lipoprotein n=1 Tax=Microbacterium dauci TaxID=3048008 RepID=A0ABT6ZAW0_9MICO|nr:hypothetical protein [Microbacterium sp. LX3-4]MDJ1113068.1 hypothetical protein [Microbacterium sp. LX3-4]
MFGGRLLAALVAGALTLTIAACGAPGTAPTPGATEAALDAWLHQERADEGDRRARVRVVNDAGTELALRGIRVESPLLADPIERDAPPLPAGESIDLTVELPPVACDQAAAAGTIVLVLDDGEEALPLRDPLGFLGRLHDRECLAERVQKALSLAWSDFSPGVAGEPGSLRLVGGVADGVRVRSVQSTPLLQFGDGVLAYDLPTGALDVRVPLVPQRCDPHVVQEDKRGTIFALDVEVDGVPGAIELAADAATKARILTWVADWCGFGG